MKKLIIYLNVIIFCWTLKCCESRVAYSDWTDVLDYLTLEQEILSLMGFPEAPKDTEKPPIRKRSAPNYMMKIYKESKSTTQPPAQGKLNVTEESDIIVNFMPYNPQKGDGEKPDNVRRLWFDVSEITKDNYLQFAELKLYRRTEGLRKKFRGAYKIVVERVYLDGLEEKEFEHIDTVITPADFEGWISLNVTRVFRYWTEHPRDNRGIRLLTYPTNQENKRVKAENMGIVGFDGPEDEQPFVTGFYKHGNHEKVHRITKRSNVIISFMAQQPYKGEGEKPDNVRRMWFDVSKIAKDNDLEFAELRLYRTTKRLQRKYRGAYEIIVERVYYDEYDEKQFEDIDFVVTPAEFEGWITLNVTRVLLYWMKYPHDNYGIRVLTYPVNRGGRRVEAEDIGIVGFDGPEDKQPFITGYYKNRNNNKIQMKFKDELERRRRKRSTEEKLSVDTFTHRQLNRSVSTYIGECKRHNYHVNFKDITWHEWIIAPEGYDMYFCDGKCTYPLTTTHNATNYAIVLALYHQLHPEKVPEPCCIASKLSPIQLLYFENQNRVVYKKFTSMVVDGCGCR